MKKIILFLFLIFYVSPMVYAQTRAVFSSTLAGGTTYTPTRKTFYNPGAPAAPTAHVAKPVQTVKKLVIKYAPDQTAPTSAQSEKLAPLFKRIREGKTKSIQLTCITRDYNFAYHRLDALSKILYAYNIDLPIDFQYITGVAVLKSNDNTIEILEYR